MVNAFRVTVGRISAIHIPRSAFIGLQLIWWPLCLIALIAIALQFGVWHEQIDIAGPFAPATNPPQQSFILSVPSEGTVPWWRQPLIGDSTEKPFESKLRLRIGGLEIWPAHSDPALIREGKSAGYSHRGSDLVFSLPPGVKNGPETVVTVWYKIRPRPWVTLASALLTLGLGFLRYEVIRSLVLDPLKYTGTVRPYAEKLAPILCPAPYVMLLGLLLLGLAGSLAFLGSSLYAQAIGWALPTTAPLHWFSWVVWAARNEPYLGYLILTLAGFGTLTTWLAAWTKQHGAIATYETKLKSFLCWSGFPLAVTAFLLCVSAMWDGIVRPGDPNWANIGGLVPFSDAHGHLAEAFFEAKQGTWSPWALRRPLAAAFRSVLLFGSDYSFPAMLVVQACLLAFVLGLASYAVMIWRGIWSGLAYFAVTYIYTRTFMPTSLTEPLGLFWALLSVPFFVASFRSGSVKPALVAFTMTSMALMTRMGSMFTIPALLLWLPWQFGRTASDKFKIGACAIGILLAVLGTNSFLSKAYGSGDAETGSNFSYTLCGLTIGTTWDGCLTKLADRGEPLTGDEGAVARRLYAFAWENFRENPAVFFKRLAAGAKQFVTTFPSVIWKGYGGAVDQPVWFFPNVLTLLCLIGLFHFTRSRMSRREIAFWALLLASITASSAIIYYDDGPRTLAASHPLIALFLAIGLGNPELPASKAQTDRKLVVYGTSGLIVAAVLLISGPSIAYRLSSTHDDQNRELRAGQDEVFVFGGRNMSGFLVVADDAPLRADVATLHFKDFEALVTQSGVEVYQGLVHPVSPPVPFGFLFAAPVKEGAIGPNIFIVPANVMENRSERTWHFRLQPWLHKADAQGRYWFFVTGAEPGPT